MPIIFFIPTAELISLFFLSIIIAVSALMADEK